MATIFNATEYLALYPELAQFGLNADNVYEAHYVPYGAAELRAPNNELAGKIYPASVLAYANGNPELAEYFGITVPATQLTQQQQADLVLHYVNYGNAEDRADKLVDAPVEEDEVPVTDLVEALVAYQNAEADYEATVAAAEKALDTDDIDGAVAAANGALVGLQFSDAEGGAILPNFGGPVGTDGAPSAKDKEAMLSLTETNLVNAVDLAKFGLSPAQQSAVIRFEKAKADLTTATENMYSANVAAAGVAATFSANTGPTVTLGATTVGPLVEGGKEVVSLYVEDPETTLVIQNGKVVAFDSDAKTTADVPSAVTGLAGYSDLVAALKSIDAAAKKVDVSADALTAAGNTLAAFKAVQPGAEPSAPAVEGEIDGALDDAAVNGLKVVDQTTLVGALKSIKDVKLADGKGIQVFAQDLSDAQADLAEFEKLADNYRDAVAETAKVDAATEARDEALEFLQEEFGVEVQVISAAEQIANATRGDDLFVYAAGEKTFKGEVFGFNEVGEDAFFFGSEFTWTVLEAGADITKAGNGDRDVLEILALQNGDDLVLYVETDAAGGTVLGEANINTITLAGVNLEDVDFSAGFLTGAVA